MCLLNCSLLSQNRKRIGKDRIRERNSIRGGGPPRGAVFGRGLTVAPWVMKEKKGVGSLFRRKGVGFSGRRKDSRPLFCSALFGKRSYCEKITPLVDGGARASGDTGPDRGRLLCPLLYD